MTNVHFFGYSTLSIKYSKTLSSFVSIVSLPFKKRQHLCYILFSSIRCVVLCL